MKTITYNLNKINSINSNNIENGLDYYKDIKLFTDYILANCDQFLANFIDDLFDFVKLNSKWYDKNGIKDSNLMKDELIFESLMLGVLWDKYSKKAFNSDYNAQKLLTNLSDFRNNLSEDKQELKNQIDEIRGYLGTMFFLDYSNEVADSELSLINLKILFDWLKSTGEFCHELNHLIYWIDYLTIQSDEKVEDILCEILRLGHWFYKVSKNKFNFGDKYVSNLDNFIDNDLHSHINKEDIIFCSRSEVEYYLNMLGAEIMNRIFKAEFNSRPRKAVLLPSCMKIINGKFATCQSEEKKLGHVCNMCNNDCNICKITKKGLKEGYETYIIDHESTAFSKATKKDKEELAIVGVACILNLISGGWKAESLGIPAQCVILNYVGCSNHWDDEGFPTAIDCDELANILALN